MKNFVNKNALWISAFSMIVVMGSGLYMYVRAADPGEESDFTLVLTADDPLLISEVGGLGGSVKFTATTTCNGLPENANITLFYRIDGGPIVEQKGPVNTSILEIDVPTDIAGLVTVTAITDVPFRSISVPLKVVQVSFEPSFIGVELEEVAQTTATVTPQIAFNDVILSVEKISGDASIDKLSMSSATEVVSVTGTEIGEAKLRASILTSEGSARAGDADIEVGSDKKVTAQLESERIFIVNQTDAIAHVKVNPPGSKVVLESSNSDKVNFAATSSKGGDIALILGNTPSQSFGDIALRIKSIDGSVLDEVTVTLVEVEISNTLSMCTDQYPMPTFCAPDVISKPSLGKADEIESLAKALNNAQNEIVVVDAPAGATASEIVKSVKWEKGKAEGGSQLCLTVKSGSKGGKVALNVRDTNGALLGTGELVIVSLTSLTVESVTDSSFSVTVEGSKEEELVLCEGSGGSVDIKFTASFLPSNDSHAKEMIKWRLSGNGVGGAGSGDFSGGNSHTANLTPGGRLFGIEVWCDGNGDGAPNSAEELRKISVRIVKIELSSISPNLVGPGEKIKVNGVVEGTQGGTLVNFDFKTGANVRFTVSRIISPGEFSVAITLPTGIGPDSYNVVARVFRCESQPEFLTVARMRIVEVSCLDGHDLPNGATVLRNFRLRYLADIEGASLSETSLTKWQYRRRPGGAWRDFGNEPEIRVVESQSGSFEIRFLYRFDSLGDIHISSVRSLSVDDSRLLITLPGAGPNLYRGGVEILRQFTSNFADPMQSCGNPIITLLNEGNAPFANPLIVYETKDLTGVAQPGGAGTFAIPARPIILQPVPSAELVDGQKFSIHVGLDCNLNGVFDAGENVYHAFVFKQDMVSASLTATHEATAFTVAGANGQNVAAFAVGSALLQQRNRSEDVSCCLQVFQAGASVPFINPAVPPNITQSAEITAAFGLPQNLVLVNTITGPACNAAPGQRVLGCGRTPSNPPDLVLTNGVGGSIYVHEYGHTRGLLHRNDDPDNIMHRTPANTDSVNREESDAFRK